MAACTAFGVATSAALEKSTAVAGVSSVETGGSVVMTSIAGASAMLVESRAALATATAGTGATSVAAGVTAMYLQPYKSTDQMDIVRVHPPPPIREFSIRLVHSLLYFILFVCV